MGALATLRLPWRRVREAVTVADSAITAYNYAAMPSGWYPIEARHNGIILAVWSTGAEEGDGTARILGRCQKNGPVIDVGSIACVIGGRLVVKDPISQETITGRWIDTMTVTQRWIKTISTTPAVTDGISMAWFDLGPLRDLYVELTGFTNFANVYVVATFF